MIKSQNQKIQELCIELEKKDQQIYDIQQQLHNNDASKLQVENFKRQCSIVEEKLNLYESESTKKISFLNDQLKQVLIRP